MVSLNVMDSNVTVMDGVDTTNTPLDAVVKDVTVFDTDKVSGCIVVD